MKTNFYKIIFHPLLHAAGAIVYIFGVSWFMNNGEKFFPNDMSIFGPALLLMVFVLSAAVMSVLFFLKPVLLYMENKKKDSLWFLGLTIAWFVFLTAVMFAIVALSSK